MIQEFIYPQNVSNTQNYQQNWIVEDDMGFNDLLQISPQITATFKRHSQEPKFIKQLRSKAFKMSHKKIQNFLQKSNHRVRRSLQQSNERSSISDDKQIQSRHQDSQETKKSIRKDKILTPQNIKKKQKFIQPSTIFNPEAFLLLRQSMAMSRQKSIKKSKGDGFNGLQLRVRQSRSQSKGEKVDYHKNLAKSTLNTYDHQSNMQIQTKHNSYHSLDKNQPKNNGRGYMNMVSSKIEEKLHLPSLARHSQLKQNRQTLSLGQENNETEIEKSHFYTDSVSKRQKSSPFIQKIIKIPIDRLKPLKPQEIRLKFEQKVRQQQKNRAKQRAIQIFEKQQKESELKKQQINLGYESEQQQSVIIRKDNRVERENFHSIRSKQSLRKREIKLQPHNVDSIFKNLDFRQRFA